MKSYIVTFKTNKRRSDSDSDSDCEDRHHAIVNRMTNTHKCNIKERYDHAIAGALIEIDASKVDQLRQDPDIEDIEENLSVQAAHMNSNGVQAATFPISGVTQPIWYQTVTNLPTNNTIDHSNINCYVVDSGIDNTHIEFNPGQVSLDYSAVAGAPTAKDDFWHGTAVSSIIGGNNIGIANNISLHAIKVLDSTGNGSYANVISGLNWIIRNKKINPIINMSLAGGLSSTLNRATTSCINAGIPVICAAGNTNVDIANVSPASTKGTYSMGAFDSAFAKASFSNYGSSLYSFMPGVNVYGAYLTSTHDQYSSISGTSFSSPMAAGLIARIIKSNPTGNISTLVSQKQITGKLTGLPAKTPNRYLKY